MNHIYCARCGERIADEYSCFDVDDEPWCEDCNIWNTYNCAGCGHAHSDEYAWQEDYPGDSYCEACVEKRFSLCDGCGGIIALDDPDPCGWCEVEELKRLEREAS